MCKGPGHLGLEVGSNPGTFHCFPVITIDEEVGIGGICAISSCPVTKQHHRPFKEPPLLMLFLPPLAQSVGSPLRSSGGVEMPALPATLLSRELPGLWRTEILGAKAGWPLGLRWGEGEYGTVIRGGEGGSEDGEREGVWL